MAAPRPITNRRLPPGMDVGWMLDGIPTPFWCAGAWNPGLTGKAELGLPCCRGRHGRWGRSADEFSASVFSVLRVLMLRSSLTVVSNESCLLRNNTLQLIPCIQDGCTFLVRVCTVSVLRSAEVKRDNFQITARQRLGGSWGKSDASSWPN